MGSAQHNTRSWAGYLIYAKWRQTNGRDEIVQTVDTVFFARKLWNCLQTGAVRLVTRRLMIFHIFTSVRMMQRKSFGCELEKSSQVLPSNIINIIVGDLLQLPHFPQACEIVTLWHTPQHWRAPTWMWAGQVGNLVYCAVHSNDAMGVGHTTVKKDRSSEKWIEEK